MLRSSSGPRKHSNKHRRLDLLRLDHAVGGLPFMNLLDRSGIAPLTGQWSDFIPTLWVLAYLLAYAAGILVQVFICRSRGRDFTFVNIAVAFIFAFPGSVPLFFLLFSLLANFLSRIFGQP